MINNKAIQREPLVYRHSFVVRIWREVGLSKWRGWVQHACTGDAILIRELDDLLAFIEDRTGGWVDQSAQGSEVSREEIGLK
jgi:hypothetical protein